MDLSREAALERDRRDPLAPLRRRFELPPGLIYLDGNSLGALPRATPRRLREVVQVEWGAGLIRGWEEHAWLTLPLAVGDKIARLLGARPGEVAVADSTSVNLFKLLAAAVRLRPGRTVILAEEDDFPTDLYIAEGVADLLAGCRVRRTADVGGALDRKVAAAVVSHVHYRRGELRDMAGITRQARAAGALVVWDLSHSAGALPVDLAAAGAELAVGCGYKFLNGGPGAPAFLYVAEALQAAAANPLPGWLGHAEPFAFESRYRPAPGIARFLSGTPPILALAALETGVDTVLAADPGALRRKSMALGDLFLESVAARIGDPRLVPACPSDAARRGSQVCFTHPEAAAVFRALVACGVLGDLRPPDLLRFGLAPLFLRYVDVWDAVEALRRVLEAEPAGVPPDRGGRGPARET